MTQDNVIYLDIDNEVICVPLDEWVELMHKLKPYKYEVDIEDKSN